MILLEEANVVIRDFLTQHLPFAKPTNIDQAFVDFDGVRHHIHTPERKTTIVLSTFLPCWDQLVKYGAQESLQREFGQWLTQPEADYSFTLAFDQDKVPADEESRAELIRSCSLIKRTAMAAPFEQAFAQQKKLEDNPPEEGTAPSVDLITINYRPEEAIYINTGVDRVTVVFSTTFKEETDRIFGKVFLQEFVDARRQPAIQGAPQVLYSSREPPLEIRHVPGLSRAEDVGYVTFVLFPRHYANPDRAYATITQIQLFRDYLHYHIKCSKAYMHTRMRARAAEFLKILNRAKPDSVEKERKTITGRTFVRG